MPAYPLKRRALPFVVLALALAGCTTYPLGMSEAEWNRLTPEQQLAARTKQAELNRARAEARARRRAEQRAEQARRAAEEARRAAEERRRIDRLYAHARYGDILECVIEDGIADFHPGWRRYRPVAFTLARGERKYVGFSDRYGKGGRFWSHYADDGLAVTVCYRESSRRGSRKCMTASGLSRDFRMGVEWTLSIDDAFRNARMTCAFRPGRGMPRYVRHRLHGDLRRLIQRYHHRNRPAASRRMAEESRWYLPPRRRR